MVSARLRSAPESRIQSRNAGTASRTESAVRRPVDTAAFRNVPQPLEVSKSDDSHLTSLSNAAGFGSNDVICAWGNASRAIVAYWPALAPTSKITASRGRILRNLSNNRRSSRRSILWLLTPMPEIAIRNRRRLRPWNSGRDRTSAQRR